MVKQQRREGMVDPNIAVQICGLTKTYPGTMNIGCCKCKKTSPYHAIKVLNLFTYAVKYTCHCYRGSV